MNRIGSLVLKITLILSTAAVTFALSTHIVSAPGTYSRFFSQARSDNNTFSTKFWATTPASLSDGFTATTMPGVAFELADTTGTSIQIETGSTDTTK